VLCSDSIGRRHLRIAVLLNPDNPPFAQQSNEVTSGIPSGVAARSGSAAVQRTYRPSDS
jgi:hypothetical protein